MKGITENNSQRICNCSLYGLHKDRDNSIKQMHQLFIGVGNHPVNG